MSEDEPEEANLETADALLHFGNLSDSDQQAALLRLDSIQLAAGETLFRQGEVGDAAYLLIEGRVELAETSPGDRERSLAVLESGALFGELALLTGQKRPATATALTNSRLLGLKSSVFESALDGCEPWAIHLLLGVVKILALRQADTDRKLRRLLADSQREPSEPSGVRVAEIEQLRTLLFTQWSF